MALNLVDSLLGSVVSPQPSILTTSTVEDTAKTERIVVGKTSATAEDGTTVTTIRYSDGTVETEKTPGDTVILSAQAQSLFTNRA